MILTLNKNNFNKKNVTESLGIKGNTLNTLLGLNLNITPSFFIQADDFNKIGGNIPLEILEKGVHFIEEKMEKKLGDANNPLLLEVFLSPSLAIDINKPISGIGFTAETTNFLANQSSDDFVYGKYKNFLVSALKSDQKNTEDLDLEKLKDLSPKEACSILEKNWKGDFLTDPYKQLNDIIVYLKKEFYSEPINKNTLCAMGIRAVLLDEKTFYSGQFHTRNTETGFVGIEGTFIEGFPLETKKPTPIKNLPQNILKELTKISFILENHFKQIRTVEFVIDQPLIWITDEYQTVEKSAKSSIKILSDLHSKGTIDDNYFLKNITDKEVSNILFPSFSADSKKDLLSEEFGEVGSIGVARGRVFFSTKALIKAYKNALVKKEDPDVILCMAATYAGDVEAIELGKGVICSEGGYASHAPVVARSLGRPAIIEKELNIGENSVKIGEQLIKEGDYISMEVQTVKVPKIYFGKAEFQETNTDDSNLQKILEVANRKIQLFKTKNKLQFDILANADSAIDITRSIQFGADGVGLCRTEHMFFEKERINFFRLLLISDEPKTRSACLEKLKSFQKEDFLAIFNVLEGRALTVRMLDAPLHEFIPNNEDDFKELQELLKGYTSESVEDIKNKFQRLEEVNPMLGHRGCRFGISFPEVYEMQEAALIEAALEYFTRNVKNKVQLKVMFPLVSLMEELNFLRNGKNIEDRVILGFKGIVKSVCSDFNLDELPFPLQTGVMIEVPAAALSSAQIAEKSEFFSFGTNDLVQMTYGMSRDDINSFYPSYTQYDIVKENPFIHLLDSVKKLILYSVNEGRLKRPDLYTSICGEHGATADTVKFCLENKINAVSCSNFNLPVIKLVTAQHLIN